MRALAVALAVAVTPAAATHPIAPPAVYAHRGGAGIAPENTLGAFRQAHALYGAQGVWLEMDTQPTADGVLVIIHDDTLDRTTNCSGDVVQRPAAEVTACDASESFPGWGAFEPVPTARDVLDEGRDAGWRILIELKNIPGEANFDPSGIDAADELLRLVDETGFPKERIVVQSFWPPSLDRIELSDPAVATALLTTSQLPGAPPGAGFYATENAAYSTARGYEVVAPDQESPDLSADTVVAIRALGRDVVVWTVDEPADILRAASWLVDGIITDRPDVAYATLGAH